MKYGGVLSVGGVVEVVSGVLGVVDGVVGVDDVVGGVVDGVVIFVVDVGGVECRCCCGTHGRL